MIIQKYGEKTKLDYDPLFCKADYSIGQILQGTRSSGTRVFHRIKYNLSKEYYHSNDDTVFGCHRLELQDIRKEWILNEAIDLTIVRKTPWMDDLVNPLITFAHGIIKTDLGGSIVLYMDEGGFQRLRKSRGRYNKRLKLLN